MNRSVGLMLCAVLPLVTPAPARAQSDDDTPLRCVSLNRIDRTEVIDGLNIVFYLRGGDIYVNRMDRECSRLAREKRFSYRVTTGSLCSSDIITVIERTGPGLGAGPSCGLGMFHPADEALIAMLKGDEEPAEIRTEEIPVER